MFKKCLIVFGIFSFLLSGFCLKAKASTYDNSFINYIKFCIILDKTYIDKETGETVTRKILGGNDVCQYQESTENETINCNYPRTMLFELAQYYMDSYGLTDEEFKELDKTYTVGEDEVKDFRAYSLEKGYCKIAQ